MMWGSPKSWSSVSESMASSSGSSESLSESFSVYPSSSFSGSTSSSASGSASGSGSAPPPPPPWPPPYLRATLQVRGNYEQLEFDLTLYPNYPANPTVYVGQSQDPPAYISVSSTIGPTTSTFTPFIIEVYGQYEYFLAYYGTPVQIPNNAFQFLNDDWGSQTPSNAQITLIVEYP